MKHTFTTNWHIYRVCSLSISTPKSRCNISSENVATSKSLPQIRSFKDILLEAVDEALSSLGNSAKQTTYIYLEKNFNIKKQDIPNKIDRFANAIEKIFGNGAKILEIQIMKNLHKKIGHNFEYFPKESDLLFTEYVEAASR